jgi:RNA polymerase sigma-70 factor (ECF subfamily)
VTADPSSNPRPADQALTELVNTQGDRLFALGLRFCGNHDEAEDLVQETFLQAYRSWDQFEERSNPATWLYTIASRVCQRFHRKKSGEPAQMESLDELLPMGAGPMGVVPNTEDGPLDTALREESRREVEEAIAELPIEFRMPLVLKEIVGFSLDEIAKIMDIPEATVKTRLYRARLRLRQALEQALPTRDVPAPVYSQQVCLDLLQAKQESLDREVAFEFPPDIVCERCSQLFATMDLAQDVCHDIGKGSMPGALRAQLMASFQNES